METRANFWTGHLEGRVVNRNDIITHNLLGMDVWELAEIDKSTVETLDGSVVPVLSFNVISGGSETKSCVPDASEHFTPVCRLSVKADFHSEHVFCQLALPRLEDNFQLLHK